MESSNKIYKTVFEMITDAKVSNNKYTASQMSKIPNSRNKYAWQKSVRDTLSDEYLNFQDKI